ncbi:unnamed protein product [Durusdinium trenchii]|uniref:Uncharacterized protein n=1 Tax=Durusdinium trenchii TaxID=1381693 RepID=A0ABP0K1R2_9DINO
MKQAADECSCACCERLAHQYSELSEELVALRTCLQATEQIRAEQFLAQLHRQRFEKLLQRCPCNFDASLEEAMQAPGMSLQVAGLLGHTEALSISQCSKLMRSCLHGVSIELAELFPQQTLVLGGVDANGEATSSVESFDIGTNAWTPLSRLRLPRWSCACASAQGRVFVMGGRSVEDEILDSVEAYDVQRGCWSHAPSLNFARCELAAAACRGLLFAAQGVTEGEVPLAEIEWLPVARERAARDSQWLRAPRLHSPKRALAAVALGDAVYLLGGWDDLAGQPSSEVNYLKIEGHDQLSDGWRRAPPLQEPRAGLGAAALMGSIWAIGGCRGQQDLTSLERFTPGGHWELVTHLQEPRRACCVVPCGSSLLVLGGVKNQGDYVASLSRLDVRHKEWCPLEVDLVGSRRYFTACACRLRLVENVDGELKCAIC